MEWGKLPPPKKIDNKNHTQQKHTFREILEGDIHVPFKSSEIV